MCWFAERVGGKHNRRTTREVDGNRDQRPCISHSTSYLSLELRFARLNCIQASLRTSGPDAALPSANLHASSPQAWPSGGALSVKREPISLSAREPTTVFIGPRVATKVWKCDSRSVVVTSVWKVAEKASSLASQIVGVLAFGAGQVQSLSQQQN